MPFQLLDAELVQVVKEALSILDHGLDHVVGLYALGWAIAFLEDVVIGVQEFEHAQQPLFLRLPFLDVFYQPEPLVFLLLTSIVTVTLDDRRDHVD